MHEGKISLEMQSFFPSPGRIHFNRPESAPSLPLLTPGHPLSIINRNDEIAGIPVVGRIVSQSPTKLMGVKTSWGQSLKLDKATIKALKSHEFQFVMKHMIVMNREKKNCEKIQNQGLPAITPPMRPLYTWNGGWIPIVESAISRVDHSSSRSNHR
jgi:hypothetical protein